MIRAALITAGGHGRRMGSPLPKQYLLLNRTPILALTLKVFADHPLIDEIVLTVPPGDEGLCRETVVAPVASNKVTTIVPGGPDRQASVWNGLQALVHTDLVAIHDGVRPLVLPQVITATLSAAESVGAAVAAVTVRDTVKMQCASHIKTVPREDLWLAHTPQTFRTALIREAHGQALRDWFRGTDDAVLVERLGHPVTLVQDSEENIKITTPEDLELAAYFLQRRRDTAPTY
jgi:2-C-methyl-D-erythritol 4-phosphate cytidylyltransferase